MDHPGTSLGPPDLPGLIHVTASHMSHYNAASMATHGKDCEKRSFKYPPGTRRSCVHKGKAIIIKALGRRTEQQTVTSCSLEELWSTDCAPSSCRPTVGCIYTTTWSYLQSVSGHTVKTNRRFILTSAPWGTAPWTRTTPLTGLKVDRWSNP